jgi:hypothetical protein
VWGRARIIISSAKGEGDPFTEILPLINNSVDYFPAYPKLEIPRITIFKRTIVFTLQCHTSIIQHSLRMTKKA